MYSHVARILRRRAQDVSRYPKLLRHTLSVAKFQSTPTLGQRQTQEIKLQGKRSEGEELVRITPDLCPSKEEIAHNARHGM